jgi:negative regulator of flagellin synthesis FlgM
MKIDNQNTISGISLYQKDPLSGKEDAGRQTGKTSGQEFDRVELSTRKDEVEKLEKAINELPDVRSEKVASLRQQIADGTYHIESTKVAEKILASRKGTNDSGGKR